METMHARPESWALHVQAWNASRLTQVAYCQQHELKPKALAYWVRRHKQATSPLNLVPLAVQGPSVSGELLLQYVSGWQLALPAGVDATWLAGLLRGGGLMLTPAQVWLVVEPVDMRLGIDGLSAHIQQALGRPPYDGTAYAFRNRRGSRLTAQAAAVGRH